jgi:hypothetical protein
LKKHSADFENGYVAVVICEFDLDQAVVEQSADPPHRPVGECSLAKVSFTFLRMVSSRWPADASFSTGSLARTNFRNIFTIDGDRANFEVRCDAMDDPRARLPTACRGVGPIFFSWQICWYFCWYSMNQHINKTWKSLKKSSFMWPLPGHHNAAPGLISLIF